MTRVEFDSMKRSLDDLLRQARDGRLQLPDFQRGWVWDDEGIRALLLSILRSFPIGALMTLEAGGELRFKSRLIEGASGSDPRRGPEALLLDGQQRITSLYLATMQKDPVSTNDPRKGTVKRHYYIDMEAALTDSLGRRRPIIVGIPADRIERGVFGRKIVRDLSTPEKEFEACMFPTNLIFDDREWQHRFDDFWTERGDREKRRFYRDFHDKIITAFLRYQIPLIELGRNTSREAVCLVFEKVNTGGKKLDAFELLTAIYAADEFNLRIDWFGDERTNTQGRLARLRKHKVLSELKSTDFLQAVSLVHTYALARAGAAAGNKETSPVTCTRDAVLNLPLRAYADLALKVEKGFERAARFLWTQKIFASKDVPYHSQIIPLAAILADIGDLWDHDAVRNKLARWYWCGVFGELYGSAVESRFARDVPEVAVWIDGGPPPSTVQEAIFTAKRLDSLRSRLSAAYKGVHALLMREGARDLRSGQSFEDSVYFDETVDIHHIFPKIWCQKQKINSKTYDSIVNKTPISARTNRVIGGQAPSAYLKRLADGGGIDTSNLALHLKSHHIDEQSLRDDDFERFFAARREALLGLISAVMQKPTYRGSTRGDEPVGDHYEEEAEDVEA